MNENDIQRITVDELDRIDFEMILVREDDKVYIH